MKVESCVKNIMQVLHYWSKIFLWFLTTIIFYLEWDTPMRVFFSTLTD